MVINLRWTMACKDFLGKMTPYNARALLVGFICVATFLVFMMTSPTFLDGTWKLKLDDLNSYLKGSGRLSSEQELVAKVRSSVKNIYSNQCIVYTDILVLAEHFGTLSILYG